MDIMRKIAGLLLIVIMATSLTYNVLPVFALDMNKNTVDTQESTASILMNMEVSALDGKTYYIRDFTEDYIAVFFGRSGCYNTRRMSKTAADVRDEGVSIKVIIMDVDDVDDGLREYAESIGALASLNNPYNDRKFWQLIRKEKLAEGSVTLPGSFVLDSERNLIYSHVSIDVNGLKSVFKKNNNIENTTVDPLHLKWNVVDGKSYWYENGVKQGTYDDSNGVIGDGTVRGREIYDPASNAWYWLDSCYDGAKAVGKEVWMPYIYQNEGDWDDAEICSNANASDECMRDQVYDCMMNRVGKWVRYDENGRMLKGWVIISGALAELYPDQAGNIYYYDHKTGLMAKGRTVIDGRTYYFDEVTGALK